MALGSVASDQAIAQVYLYCKVREMPIHPVGYLIASHLSESRDIHQLEGN
jgi:hypothetical protein